MDVKKEDDLLEETLSISETDYAQAYRFLLAAYEKEPGGFGPQTLYFLACLAGGAGMQDAALSWLRTAIEKNGWWYRPEGLVDRRRGRIGPRLWREMTTGSWRPSKAPSRTDTERSAGATMTHPSFRSQTPWMPCRARATIKSRAAAFRPGAICCCALLRLPRRAAIF